MKILEVSGSSIKIQLPQNIKTENIEILNGSKKIASELNKTPAGEITAEIKIKDISIYENLTISTEVGEHSLGNIFEKYKLDKEKLNDEYYVTRKIINAGTRNMNDNELFFAAYNALAIMPAENHFYGALITLTSYKYLEAPEEREWILKGLIDSKKKFDKSIKQKTPDIVRWVISSATALSILLLLNDFIDEAEEVIDTAISKFEPNYNQLSYWNYCQCLILKSTILTYKGKQSEAGWKYLEAFDFSRKAINDIYHPRNDWVLGQISDCQALLSLGELALKCATKCLGKIPPASRYADIQHNGSISLSPIFSRCRDSRSKFKGRFFDTTEKILGMV